jgi:hypothetical protein
MGTLSETSLGDITRAASRYRPVAITVAAVLVALAVLPEPKFRDQAAFSPTFGEDTVSAGDEGDEVAAAPPAADAPPVTIGPDVSFDQEFTSDFSSGDGTFSDESTRGLGATSGDSSFDTSASAPLFIVRSGWWSATAATPLGGEGVAEGTLPVGKRVGQDDKRSFIELAGDESILTMKEEAEGSRQQLGAPQIQICPISTEWEDAEGMTESPPYDTNSCVTGSYGDGGVWTFDLTQFGAVAEWAGFAIVPAPGAPVDFQVNLLPS